jgi:hypothetical protein
MMERPTELDNGATSSHEDPSISGKSYIPRVAWFDLMKFSVGIP